MQEVVTLAPREGARLDADRLDSLYSQLGPRGAENVVCRAMEELAYRLGHIDRLYCQADLAEMRRNTRALMAIADQIGMTGLTHVAKHVITCIDDTDETALAATLARLARYGERSLTAIWELQDLSI
ncbi:hypothetical protein DU478_02310 [Thalassococcus profundi]|uniref:HPt domain-containing protein n=1 Tax=Thalassococcus profundi TaxID=2282382 RepID=A0A369TS18_9RHOB|nr:hypothetical protein [Thalassococcus profundi]RDD67514.1 hypothetical protein DU478_02310 [Thalassococcus profundi]